VLPFCFREAVDRLNPEIPFKARDEAIKKVLRAESQDLVTIIALFTKCW